MSGKYEPYPRDYIKQQVYLHLKGMAQANTAPRGERSGSGRR